MLEFALVKTEKSYVLFQFSIRIKTIWKITHRQHVSFSNRTWIAQWISHCV